MTCRQCAKLGGLQPAAGICILRKRLEDLLQHSHIIASAKKDRGANSTFLIHRAPIYRIQRIS